MVRKEPSWDDMSKLQKSKRDAVGELNERLKNPKVGGIAKEKEKPKNSTEIWKAGMN